MFFLLIKWRGKEGENRNNFSIPSTGEEDSSSKEGGEEGVEERVEDCVRFEFKSEEKRWRSGLITSKLARNEKKLALPC